jgi:hypothetical protein
MSTRRFTPHQLCDLLEPGVNEVFERRKTLAAGSRECRTDPSQWYRSGGCADVACDLQVMALLAWRTGRFAPDPMRCYQKSVLDEGCVLC